MATVQIADIYNPLTFGRRAQEAQTEANRLIRSGIVIEDAKLREQFAQGGNIGECPFFNPLATGEPNYSTDNPASNSEPANTGSTKQIARLAHRNKSWSTMDLARELALEDPIGAITGRIGNYWATDDQKRVIQSALGILADNIDNDGGDMLESVANDSADAVTDNERISADVLIDGEQTLGDAQFDVISAMAIHSTIYARLRKQNLIDYVPTGDQGETIPTYLGRTLIVDDTLPAIAGSNRITYTCILFGAGSILTAPGRVIIPSEMEREPSAGDGGGQDIIHSRVANAFHPNGFSFLSASVSGQSATYAELALAANWNRVVDRKNVPLAFLRVND